MFLLLIFYHIRRVAAVTTTKQTNNKKRKQENTIEIVSKSKYEKLERKYKRLARSQDKTAQRVEDLRFGDNCKNSFIFNYLKSQA
jgi:hypothetical protein